VGKIKSGDESSHQDRGVIAKSSVRTDMPVLINVEYNKFERTRLLNSFCPNIPRQGEYPRIFQEFRFRL